MNINKEEFERFIPAGISADSENFEKVYPYILNALKKLEIEYVGPTLMSEEVDGLSCVIKECACIIGFKNAIPMLDVILTNNGFAVASDSTVAPASKERIERLIGQLEYQIAASISNVIYTIEKNDQFFNTWIKVDKMGYKVYQSLVFNPSEMEKIACCYLTMESYYDYQNKIHAINAKLFEHIGIRVYNSILQRAQKGEMTDVDLEAVNLFSYIYKVEMNTNNLERIKRTTIEFLVGFFEDHLDSYPEFEFSPAHTAKNTSRYENKQEHETFFFS